MQVEALKRYRSGGEQRVLVQHVNVAAHQAQVNLGAQGEGGQSKLEEQPYGQAAITDAREPPMPGSIEALAATMPVAGGQW